MTQTLSVLSVQKAVSHYAKQTTDDALVCFCSFPPPTCPNSLCFNSTQGAGSVRAAPTRRPGTSRPAAGLGPWTRQNSSPGRELPGEKRQRGPNTQMRPVPQLSPYTHSSPLVQLAWSRGYLLWSPPHLFGDGGKGKPTGKPKLILGDPPFDAHGSTYPNLVCSSANLGFDSKIASQTRI